MLVDSVPFTSMTSRSGQTLPVRHQNSVCRISTNPTMQIWESDFLIRLSQFFVRLTNFKIRLNIGLYEYINPAWRNTKCYSEIGVIAFWNVVCFPLVPSQTTSPDHTQRHLSVVINGDVCGSLMGDFVCFEKGRKEWKEWKVLALGNDWQVGEKYCFESRNQLDRSTRCYPIK